jgi:hypothetical protein
MSNFDIEKTTDFTYKVFRIVNEVQDRTDGKEPHSYVRKYWVATFDSHKHAVAFVKSLRPTSIKGEIL